MADQLKEARALIEAHENRQARALLVELLKTEPTNDTAWVYLATVVDTEEQRVKCLEEALKHNPRNKTAQKALARIKEPWKEQPRGSRAERRKGVGDVLGWVLCAATVPLVFLGGCIGGALAGAASSINWGLQRSGLPVVIKLPIMALLVLLAYGAYLLLVAELFDLSSS